MNSCCEECNLKRPKKQRNLLEELKDFMTSLLVLLCVSDSMEHPQIFHTQNCGCHVFERNTAPVCTFDNAKAVTCMRAPVWENVESYAGENGTGYSEGHVVCKTVVSVVRDCHLLPTRKFSDNYRKKIVRHENTAATVLRLEGSQALVINVPRECSFFGGGGLKQTDWYFPAGCGGVRHVPSLPLQPMSNTLQ